MMSIIAGFLSRMILLRFFVILLGLTLFVLTLEIVGLISSILEINPSPLMSVGEYALARAPGVLNTFLPFCLLLALLLSITELSYRNEMTAIWSIGIAPSRLILMLLPVAAVVGAIQFLIADQAVPAAAPYLRNWGIGDYASQSNKVAPGDPIWVRSGTDVIQAKFVSPNLDEMKNMIIFRRQSDGLLLQQLYVERAIQVGDHWKLSNINVFDRGGRVPYHLTEMNYAGEMRLLSGAQTDSPEEMSMSQISDYIAHDGYGQRPVYVYQTWWHKRLSPFIVAFIMIALCVPLATRFRRGGGLGPLLGIGVGMGFLFFVSDGVAASIGEIGLVTPWLAAWTPTIVFGAIAAGLVARTELA
ncbi:MAG: LptF/LptG family permease [Alphaproteobacteria bacterium]|nr:LptF/LptG family permease [Alphaproteobacteria bacterium]